LLTAILCSLWQLFSTKKEISGTDSTKDSDDAGKKRPSLPKHKSVRFADEDLSEAHVTPQRIPTPTKVSLEVGTDEEDFALERSKRSSSMVTNFFRSFSRSLSLYSMKSESEDLEEVDESSHPGRLSSLIECHSTSMEDSSDLTDELSEESITMSSTVSTPCLEQKEISINRDRSKSEPVQSDENGFYVGEEVQYRGKSRWKRGIVTSINPLKVQGEGNYRARAYEQVRKLRVLPSKIGEEVDDMDVREMTFDDFKKLMKSARQNTRTSRHFLAETAKCQSQLVDTLAKNQK